MNDFAYCNGGRCPLKRQCLRYLQHMKKPTYQEAWYVPVSNEGNKCRFFVKDDEKEK